MSQSTVVKTVGGVTTKITTTTSTFKSSTQQQQHQQQHQQQQQQTTTQQKVITKPPQMGAIKDTKNSVEEKTKTVKENHASVKSSFSKSNTLDEKKQPHQQHNVPPPKIKPQQSQTTEDVCVRCNKTVYKMEEVIADDQVWHKNCFRCKECDKPLNRYNKVDSYQIHEGVAYCKFHFKQRFGPEGDAQKRKPELIIRENQPAELPDDVVRSSDKHGLGLEDIQTSAVKTRFQMFEKIATTKETQEELQPQRSIKRGATILSKVKKIHAKGVDVGVTANDLKNGGKEREQYLDYDDDDDSIHSEDYDDDTDVDLIRAKRAQRERPLTFDNMDDIKYKFEGGMKQGREERHNERKQEIQNIRSRLFLGKQARTKEMYENAIAELDTTTKLRNKSLSTVHDLDNVKAAAEITRNIKQKFETGDVYRKLNPTDQEMFDAGIGNIKEQEGNVSKGSVTGQISNKVSERMQMLAKQQAQDKTVKSAAKVKNVETADISNQFEFFENYNPEEHKKIEIRKTPPKQITEDDEDNEKLQNGIKIDGLKIDGLTISGVVKKATDTYIESVKNSKTINKKQGIKNVLDKGQNLTASKKDATQNQPASAEVNRRVYDESSESAEQSEVPSRRPGYLDSDLEQARQAARTRELKDRFEKWNYENNVYDVAEYNDSIPEYDEIDDSQTESTRTIRAKFEQLPHLSQIQRANKGKVNRFV